MASKKVKWVGAFAIAGGAGLGIKQWSSGEQLPSFASGLDTFNSFQDGIHTVEVPNSDLNPVSDSEVTTERPELQQPRDVHPELQLSSTKNGGGEKTQQERELLKAEAKKHLDRLNEYTFKLFTPCGTGTVWVLDYELPKKQGQYPTVWYFATNAHVINGLRFGDNPYQQIMPRSVRETNYLRNRWRGVKHDGLSLAYDGTCSAMNWYGHLDVSLSKQDTGPKLNSDIGQIGRGLMKEPRLFWVALNFLEKNQDFQVQENHWKDFAVLEIEFTNETVAKEITNGFADKYNLESEEALNVFSKPLEERYSWEAIEQNRENFYSLAYPRIEGNTNIWNYSVTWDENKLVADQLSEDKWNWYHDRGEKKIRGFVPHHKISPKFKWGGKEYSRFGHFYLLKNYSMDKGSSGSIHSDSNANVIGIRAVGEKGKWAHNIFLDPLRSEQLIYETLKTPKYDLILGVNGQKSSYKQQVEKYKKNTWLQARGWEKKFNRIGNK